MQYWFLWCGWPLKFYYSRGVLNNTGRLHQGNLLQRRQIQVCGAYEVKLLCKSYDVSRKPSQGLRTSITSCSDRPLIENTDKTLRALTRRTWPRCMIYNLQKLQISLYSFFFIYIYISDYNNKTLLWRSLIISNHSQITKNLFADRWGSLLQTL